MKYSIALMTGFAAFATADQVTSKPFYLYLCSSDPTLNGQKLDACHSGAAIESLCVQNGTTQYTFNTTAGVGPVVSGSTPSGTLIYNLPSTPPIPSSLDFSIDPATNLAGLLFKPGDNPVSVVFDSNSQLSLFSGLKDTVDPPMAGDTTLLQQFYMCQTNIAGYKKQTLNFKLGVAPPQNPSCVPVSVKQVYA